MNREVNCRKQKQVAVWNEKSTPSQPEPLLGRKIRTPLSIISASLQTTVAQEKIPVANTLASHLDAIGVTVEQTWEGLGSRASDTQGRS